MADSKVVRLSERLVNALEEFRKLRIKSYDLYDHDLYGDHWEREKRIYANKSLTEVLEDCVFSATVDLQTFLVEMEGLNEKRN